MAVASPPPASFGEGQPATFLVAEKFGDTLVLSDRGREFVAVLLDRPAPPPGTGINMSSAKLGDTVGFTVVRSFPSGHLILTQAGGQGTGFTYFATLVSGAS